MATLVLFDEDEINRVLKGQLAKLEQLRGESIVKRVADFEYEKATIADILEHIDEARIQFEVHILTIILRHKPNTLLVAVGRQHENVQNGVFDGRAAQGL